MIRSYNYQRCPICGLPVKGEHECPPRRLAAIDQTMKSDRDQIRTPTLGERLSYGFAALRGFDSEED